MIAWGESLARQDGPSTLIFSRQNLPFIQREAPQIEDIKRGGYVLRDADEARAVIIATGSEVELALKAQQQLADEGLAVRVVSMPCTRLFDQQTRSYIEAVLPPNLPRVAVEAGVTDYWRKYVGLTGEVVGIDSFGESAPASVLFEHFGITSAAVVKAVKAVL